MTIHIACQSTGQFAPDCAVMLRSLLVTNPDETFVVHFLHDDGIPPVDRARLAEIVTSFGASWEPVQIPDELASGFPVMERYGGLAVWFRLLLPRLLPDVRRVLYLDADLMIVEPIRELWETELSGRCLAAVTQPLLGDGRKRVTSVLGLPAADRYFNSGVMLMDLDRLRDTGLMLDAERVPKERKIPVPWADQDSLNVAMWEQRVDLHPRWNVMNPCFDLPKRLLPWPPDQVSEATKRPAIIHFIGEYKPWHYRLRHPYAERYFAHLEATPWRGRAKEGRSTRQMLLRPLPPYIAMRYEMTEYSFKQKAATYAPRALRLAQRAVSRDPRVYAAARAAYRAVSPRSPQDGLTDVLDAFADSRPGACFVQIGSNDGDYEDPLRPYVDRHNWHGVLVEPVPYVYERLRSRYDGNPRMELVNAAVAAQDGHLPFYYVAQSDDPDLPEWYDKLGSFARENILHPYHVENIPDLADRIVCQEVPCLTFETLWRTYSLPRLDLVHIDAEGYDAEILEQIDFARLRPMIVLYEHKHLTKERQRDVTERLRAGGYEVLEVGPDALAVRMDAPLLVRLAVRRHRSR